MKTALQTFQYWKKNFWRLESWLTENAKFSAVKNLHKHFIIFDESSAQEAFNSFYYQVSQNLQR